MTYIFQPIALDRLAPLDLRYLHSYVSFSFT